MSSLRFVILLENIVDSMGFLTHCVVLADARMCGIQFANIIKQSQLLGSNLSRRCVDQYFVQVKCIDFKGKGQRCIEFDQFVTALAQVTFPFWLLENA